MKRTETAPLEGWRDQGALSIPDTARVLDLGRTLAFDLARRGELKTIMLGGRRVVPVIEIKRLLGEVA
jgi:hypothetical protein